MSIKKYNGKLFFTIDTPNVVRIVEACEIRFRCVAKFETSNVSARSFVPNSNEILENVFFSYPMCTAWILHDLLTILSTWAMLSGVAYIREPIEEV